MAMSQNLSTSTYTLKQFKANVLNKTGKLSTSDMKLIKPQFDSLVHDSILTIRTLMGSSLDNFYTTKVALASTSLTAGFGTATIAVKSLSDPNKIKLYDPTLGTIPVLSADEFNNHRRDYSTTDVGTLSGIAMLLVTSATADTAPYILNVAFYTGAASPLTTVEMYYPRNPIKVTTEIDSLDIPDGLIPIAEDMTALTIMKKIDSKLSGGLEERVTTFIKFYTGLKG